MSPVNRLMSDELLFPLVWPGFHVAHPGPNSCRDCSHTCSSAASLLRVVRGSRKVGLNMPEGVGTGGCRDQKVQVPRQEGHHESLRGQSRELILVRGFPMPELSPKGKEESWLSACCWNCPTIGFAVVTVKGAS